MRVTQNRVDKAVALVVRGGARAREVLVFRHPIAGVQFPKGTVEPGESLSDAALRELKEESGLAVTAHPRLIGYCDYRTGDKAQRWHLHLIDAPPGLTDSWSHRATGSPEEDGLLFAFYWLPVDRRLPDVLEPLFSPAAVLLLDHFQE